MEFFFYVHLCKNNFLCSIFSKLNIFSRIRNLKRIRNQKKLDIALVFKPDPDLHSIIEMLSFSVRIFKNQDTFEGLEISKGLETLKLLILLYKLIKFRVYLHQWKI